MKKMYVFSSKSSEENSDYNAVDSNPDDSKDDNRREKKLKVFFHLNCIMNLKVLSQSKDMYCINELSSI